MLTIRAMTGGEGYAQRHLQQSDYYDQNRSVEGHWHGRGAELLGLKGKVTSENFEAVRQGLDPQMGEFLRQRHSADRIASDGAEQSKARSLYDMTFSAPKSVSVMAIVGGDERLVAAHEAAVREALEEAEKCSATRVRLAGLNENRTTGNWIIAAYTHDTSRELDPQLYRNTLAREVRALGYEIENRHDVRGRDKGFEIVGLSQGLLDKYSQRSAQRDAAIQEFTHSRGRAPTDNEVAVLVRETRADKLQEISTERVRNLQQDRLTPAERQTLREVLNKAQTQSHSPQINRGMHEASLAYSQEHIFERLSVAREHEVLTEALRHGRGNVKLSDLQGSLSLEGAKGTLITAGDEIATHASLQRERNMIAVVNQGVNRYDRLGKGRDFELSDPLRPEQRLAVEAVLDSRDLAINVRGAAGTGKTATLREIDRGLREAGHEVLAVAPTRSAVDELEQVGFRDAMTVSRLLEDQEPQGALRGRVLIVDEAGMISGRQMESLLHLAEDQGARVVFSGDTRQIPSVEASDALRILERESDLKSVSLTEVQRQTNSLYREAVKTIRHSPEEGSAQLEKLGAIREVPIFDRGQMVADLHREFRSEGRDTLVVAGTHDEISQLTGAIRQDRKDHGELGVGYFFDQYVSLQWTTAQKQELSNYQEGQVLQFHRDTKLAKRHESLDVVRVGPESLIARKETGDEVSLSPKQTGALPTSWQIVPQAWHAMLSYLSFHVVETPGAYNALQQLSYAAVIFLLAPFSIATGVAMSPAVAARFPWYIKIFHGRQSARSLHFLALCTFIVFFIGHVTIVALHGFRRELALIVLGQTRNPHLALALGVWLSGLTGIVAIHVVTTVCSRRRPRFVQNATQSITDPLRTLLFGHEISAQDYSPADISPYFWVNGRPPKEESYLAMARDQFASYNLKVSGLVDRPLCLTLADLCAMPKQVQITKHCCIQGWSGTSTAASGLWATSRTISACCATS